MKLNKHKQIAHIIRIYGSLLCDPGGMRIK